MLAKLRQRQSTDALEKHGLKHWENDVLSVLRRQGPPFELATSDIARSAVLTGGAMTTRIDGPESRGLLRRRRSKTDGRSVSVRLTSKGKRTVDLAIDTRIDSANQVLTNINSNARKQLAALLRNLLIDIDS